MTSSRYRYTDSDPYALGQRENRTIKGRSMEELERQFTDEELMEIARFGRVVSDPDS